MFFCHVGFKVQINHWRKRKVPSGTLTDVYDGKMWNSLKDANGVIFVEEECSLMLTLNVDWFQPFNTGRVHSVRGIYLVINNLPRAIHYKPENAILVGVMPGPSEPSKHQINHYLEPIVKELKKLYYAQQIDAAGNILLVHAALLIVACNIPAARKVTFMSFSCMFLITYIIQRYQDLLVSIHCVHVISAKANFLLEKHAINGIFWISYQ